MPCDAGVGATRLFKSVYGAKVQPKLHGFDGKLDTMQLIAWGVIGYSIAAYFALYAPFLSFAPCVGLTASVLFLGVVVISLKIYLSLSAPEDSTMYRLPLPLAAVFQTTYDPTKEKLCSYCIQIVDLRTRHCGKCDKCIHQQDHHCRWLNTCIGSKNYRAFFVFVTLVLVAMLLLCGIGLSIFIDALASQAGGTQASPSIAAPSAGRLQARAFYDDRLLKTYGSAASLPAYLTVVAVTVLVHFGSSVAVGNLWAFHIYLFVTDQSTVQWLKARESSNEPAA
mgnify:FL=1